MKTWLPWTGVFVVALLLILGAAWEGNDNLVTSISTTATGTGTADNTYVSVGHELGGYSWIEAQVSADVLTSSGQCASPTLDVTLESSLDGTNYDTVVTFTQGTTAAIRERKSALRSTTAFMGRWVRAKCAVATSSGTAIYVPTVLFMAGN